MNVIQLPSLTYKINIEFMDTYLLLSLTYKISIEFMDTYILWSLLQPFFCFKFPS